MALIKCYECEKEISDQAPACPHCGAPVVQSGFERLVCVYHPVPAQSFRYFGDLLGSASPGMGDVSLVAAVSVD